MRTVPEYSASQAAERNGRFREALQLISLAEQRLQDQIGPPSDNSCMWTQILLDEKRLSTAVYGPPRSDGRVAAWQHHVFFESDLQPPPLMFYAWVRHGNIIYGHGGAFFLKHEQFPSQDVLWAFNITSKAWRCVETTGNSPGPREGHVAVVYKDCMYVFGGKGAHGVVDNKLYRLDLSSFEWQIVKVKGLKPCARDAAAGVLYKGKIYIHGGSQKPFEYLNDLWCYSLESKRWKFISGGQNA